MPAAAAATPLLSAAPAVAAADVAHLTPDPVDPLETKGLPMQEVLEMQEPLETQQLL